MGIAALEDQVVQQAVVTVLNQIYEEDFLGFSYGFRPGRNQHDALDALWVGIMRKKVNWMVDADIRGFFDNLSHEWLVKFIEHRIADRRIVRLIQKWLRTGVSEEGKWSKTEVGTPQGAVASPLLANIYLHEMLPIQAYFGGAMVVVGAIIHTWGNARRSTQEPTDETIQQPSNPSWASQVLVGFVPAWNVQSHRQVGTVPYSISRKGEKTLVQRRRKDRLQRLGVIELVE